MIERVMGRTFGCDKEHHPLQIKNDLRTPIKVRREAAPQASSPRAARVRGQQEDKPRLLFGRFLAFFLGCASPNTPLI
jgi:hypothetical protein